MIKNTFIFNPVRPDYIHKALESLYKYTDMTDCRVIIVDQTMNGLTFKDKVHLVLRPHRNLGFAKSMNEGIIHALHWGSEYVTCANDDIEYMDKRWWDGVVATFEQYGERVTAVNPMSPLEPGWGYGLDHGEVIELLPYKENGFSSDDYDFLLRGDFSSLDDILPKTFPRQKSGCIDAIATWHTTFNKKHFEEVGLFEENFYPGGGEDYDMDARAYSKELRMLGTTKSWIWHWWGSSKDQQQSTQMKDLGLPIVDELRWSKADLLWNPDDNEGVKMDPWGHRTDQDGNKTPLIRQKEVGVVDI